MKIDYCFTFEDGTRKVFTIKLHTESLNIMHPGNQEKPEWAILANCRCQHCQLDGDAVEYCPIAVNISDIVDFFKSHLSHDKVYVLVVTEERGYGKKTTVQKALGSLLGIYMAASGCPAMEKLKPMARFHLPFATVEETVFRSASTYLIGQYFLKKQGKPADLDLVELANFYKEIHLVNCGIAERLRGTANKDAVNNAVICLDMFAKELPYAVEDSLEELQGLFSVYWK